MWTAEDSAKDFRVICAQTLGPPPFQGLPPPQFPATLAALSLPPNETATFCLDPVAHALGQ